jgi:predicted kinase
MTRFHSLVPEPESGSIDWPQIEAAFDWFRRLSGCPQDAIFHAEGDVAVHTRLVVEALLADPAWQRLGSAERESLFWAALLHDAAKPACTRIEPDGRVVAPGHSRRGQIMARLILSRIGAPFRQREEICHLITHHQLPFFLIGRERPQRRAHLISHQTRCDLLAILATADARGRICPDSARLFDNIALFGELCRDEGCLFQPKAFTSAHSRFLYFRLEHRSPDYAAFDDWHSEAVLLSGLPGSGKDTWLAGNAGGRAVISLDDLREALDVDPAGRQGPVIAAAREQARTLLRAHRPFIWNATNVSRQLRGQLVDLFAAYRTKVRIVYLEACEDEAARRNHSRENPVPAQAIARMLERWEPPDLTECHTLDVVLT